MLIALLTIFFLGGGCTVMLRYIADTKDNVKTVMVKDELQHEALAVLKAMKKRANAQDKQVKRTEKGLKELFENHESAAAEIDAVWAEHFASMDQYNDDMLDLRFELKEHVNSEEWEAIFPGD